MENFDCYFENRTPAQLRFLHAIEKSKAGNNSAEGNKQAALNEKIAITLLQSDNPELLEVIGAATIIAHQRNSNLVTILQDAESRYQIVRDYHRGGNIDAIKTVRDRETRLACSL